MKNDLKSRDDLYLLVKTFYTKLLTDDVLYPFFEKFSNPELLETHLQDLVNFWDNSLFYSGGYRKNVLKIHSEMHAKKPIADNHFNTWLSIFKTSVDALFEGENAHAIKTRAKSIAIVMKIQFSGKNV